MRNRKTPILVQFDPERWGQVTFFRKFYHTTYTFNKSQTFALIGVESHFNKTRLLFQLADRMVPNLEEDRRELDQKGFSISIRSKELAALLETIIVEMYSIVDCTRQVLFGIFGKLRGVSSKSTHKLFENAREEIIDKRVPKDIRLALIKAQWYDRLRILRDAIIHSNVGSCHKNTATNKIQYINDSISDDPKPFVIDDIFVYLQEVNNSINQFLGTIFKTLNDTLLDQEIEIACGIFNYRFYERYVSPRNAIDSNSGRCKSYIWFEKEKNFMCPFSENCGAYKNVTR